MKNKITIFVLFISTHLYGSTVLFIGDSHAVGPFGWAFDQHLRDAGHRVSTHASCGSIAKWWMNGQTTNCGYFERKIDGFKIEATKHPTPLLVNLLMELRPDVVVIELGGNYVKLTNDDFITNDIKTAVATILDSGAKCMWITHPDSRKFRAELIRISNLIEQAIGNQCTIFKSTLVTHYPEEGGDGIHYWSTVGTPIAKEWARKAFESFSKDWD